MGGKPVFTGYGGLIEVHKELQTEKCLETGY